MYEEGARALGAGLALNAALTVLDVSDNTLRARGLRALLEGVRAQQTLTALDVASCRLGDEGCETLCTELMANPTLRFVRAASNDIGAAGGRALAHAVEGSHCAALLCDASRNPAMAYQDVVRLRLCNNTRARAAGDNPLDGAKKADRCMS